MGRLAVQIEETNFSNALAFGGVALPPPAATFALGQIDGGLVTQYGADVSVLTPSLLTTDATSRAILGIFDRMQSMGYLAQITKVSPGRIYSNFHVTVTKPGKAPFAVNAAKIALTAAVAKQSLSLWNIVDAVKETVVFTAEAIPTAVSEKGRQQTADTLRAGASGAIDFVTNPICASIEGATGLSCKTVVIGGAVIVGLFFAWPVISPFITVGAERVARRFR